MEDFLQGLIVAIVLTSAFLFLMTFFFGGFEIGDPHREDAAVCDEINYNIEKLPPVKAGCWFWKPVDPNNLES